MSTEGTCCCCGNECMFCADGIAGCERAAHVCSECTYGDCPDCCGCNDCSRNKRAGFTPEGTAHISHGGLPLLGAPGRDRIHDDEAAGDEYRAALERREALDRMAREGQEAGIYEATEGPAPPMR